MPLYYEKPEKLQLNFITIYLGREPLSCLPYMIESLVRGRRHVVDRVHGFIPVALDTKKSCDLYNKAICETHDLRDIWPLQFRKMQLPRKLRHRCSFQPVSKKSEWLLRKVHSQKTIGVVLWVCENLAGIFSSVVETNQLLSATI